MGFVSISPKELSENVFELIGNKWMLITAGNREKVNMMTASWGGLGVLWSRPVATVYIRPQRYTLGFVDREDYFTLSVYDEKYRKELSLCGAKSGRELDKIAATGFTTEFSETGAPYFKEAELVLICRKLYKGEIKPEGFIVPGIDGENYPIHDYHRVFIGEITEILKKQG